MFQCLGLATEKDGGCGEDWWHPECVLGLERKAKPKIKEEARPKPADQAEGPREENNEANDEDPDDELPQGFPSEDTFETFICYKCVDVYPWIKRYAGSTGFLPPISRKTSAPLGSTTNDSSNDVSQKTEGALSVAVNTSEAPPTTPSESFQSIASNKRKAEDDPNFTSLQPKKTRVEPAQNCYYDSLPTAPEASCSLFLKEDFRDHFCRCPKCYTDLRKHPQLLEEEESYEPPLSENGDDGGRSAGTGSLLDRGEAALSNVDRVRAIG